MTPEKREKAIKWLTEEVRSLRMAPKINGCGPENWAEQLEIMETCLEAVKGHVVDTDKMVPLTLEQLRGMGEKPYWHVGLQDDSPEPHWKILDPFVARCPEDYGYGKRWLAYAYPPAHIDREAWTAEWIDNDKNEEMMCKCSKCEYPVSYFWGKTAFCPACGRAMTPEAWAELEKRLRGVPNGQT